MDESVFTPCLACSVSISCFCLSQRQQRRPLPPTHAIRRHVARSLSVASSARPRPAPVYRTTSGSHPTVAQSAPSTPSVPGTVLAAMSAVRTLVRALVDRTQSAVLLITLLSARVRKGLSEIPRQCVSKLLLSVRTWILIHTNLQPHSFCIY